MTGIWPYAYFGRIPVTNPSIQSISKRALQKRNVFSLSFIQSFCCSVVARRFPLASLMFPCQAVYTRLLWRCLLRLRVLGFVLADVRVNRPRNPALGIIIGGTAGQQLQDNQTQDSDCPAPA